MTEQQEMEALHAQIERARQAWLRWAHRPAERCAAGCRRLLAVGATGPCSKCAEAR